MSDIIERYDRNIPEEIKWHGCWCAWRINNGVKLPYNVRNGKMADASDESTFVSFYQIRHYIDKYYNVDPITHKKIGGIGIGLFYGISAIDIDHCVENGVPNEMAMDIINMCKSYTEYSPSGTGIRIIFKTKTYFDKNKYYIKNSARGLEVYICGFTKRYLTVTGDKYKFDEIREINLQPLLDKYMVRPTILNSGNDDFSKALQKDAKLYELYHKQAPGSGSNESELDMALLSKIAFYTKCDPVKTKTIFETSPYFASKDEMHKAKWNDGYHAELALQKAIEFTRGNIVSTTMSKETLKVDENGEITNKDKFTLKGTDLGNAKIFYNMFRGKVLFNHDAKMWMIWNGKYWQYDVEKKIRTLANQITKKVFLDTCDIPEENQEDRKAGFKNAKYLASSRGIDNMLKESASLLSCVMSDLDKNPYLLCCNNGIVDMQTGEIKEFDKEEMISCTTGFDIDLDHEPELFIKTLKEILDGNEEDYHYLQKAFGYSTTNITREQCMFMLIGDGNNGKSLLLKTILNVLGTYGISSKPTMLMENKWGVTMAHPEEVARLRGKRFIVIQEPKAGCLFDESVVKSMTSGIEKQTARFLYGNSFDFVLTAKMWMGGNYEPTIRGTDKGIWRRPRKIDLHVDFAGREDKDLEEKLLKEAPKILGWLVKGYKMYQNEGLNDTSSMKKSLDEYKEKMDITARWANKECELDPSYQTPAYVLFESCKSYAKKFENYDLTMTMFGRMMGKKFKKIRLNAAGGATYYCGIRVAQKTNIEKQEERKQAFKDIDLSEEDI